MSAKILATLPKFVAIPNGLTIEATDNGAEFLIPSKKRRLDHLSWEEKLQRK